MNLKLIGNKTEYFKSVSAETVVYAKVEPKGKNASLILIILKTDGGTEEKCIFKFDDTNTCEVSFDAVGYAIYNAADKFCITASNAQLAEVNVEFKDDDGKIPVPKQGFIENTVIDTHGNKYTLSVGADKELVLIPHVPNKVFLAGNSLLLGMGTYGMCSSSEKNDYAYYLIEEIKKHNPDAVFNKLKIPGIECCESYGEFCDVWNKLPSEPDKKSACESFTDDIDLIIIQMGDNINNAEKQKAFDRYGDEFIADIKKRSPKARILWVEGWYNHSVNIGRIYNLCERWHIPIISIYDLHTKENEAYKGMKYKTPNGESTVDDTWITHPGDGGMKLIADRIIKKLDM